MRSTLKYLSMAALLRLQTSRTDEENKKKKKKLRKSQWLKKKRKFKIAYHSDEHKKRTRLFSFFCHFDFFFRDTIYYAGYFCVVRAVALLILLARVTTNNALCIQLYFPIWIPPLCCRYAVMMPAYFLCNCWGFLLGNLRYQCSQWFMLSVSVRVY